MTDVPGGSVPPGTCSGAMTTNQHTTAPPAVKMRSISKSFSGVRVLDDVDFELRRGEIHALVGGNGAGKSTLMKIRAGVYSLDSGSFEIDGERVQITSPQDALRAGVGMVFQEFSLVPTLTVAQNVFLTREAHGFGGLIDDRASERRTRELFRMMGVDVDPRRTLDGLPTAYWQLTEIAKALSQEARVLIMDEPTAALAKTEAEQLFALMRRLSAQGISIVFVSHRMEEVFEVCGRITVLRDGRVARTATTSTTKMQDVIEDIVGRKVEQALEWQERAVPASDETLLEVRGLASGSRLRGVDLVLRRGEVLGLAGLMGSGRSELARALFGIDRLDAGEIYVSGRRLRLRGPEDAIAAGIALIPEDRRAQGLILDHSVRQNFVLPLLKQLTRYGLVDDRDGDRIARSFVDRLSIRLRSLGQPITLLSGGNQQKIVIAKWLGTDPQVLIMDEPTAGVDVGTKGEIVAMIRTLAESGKGVIIISSELPELLAVCDRVLVLRAGEVDRELPRTEIQAEEQLQRVIQGVA
jgi:ribose transport system ATP-binding protein